MKGKTSLTILFVVFFCVSTHALLAQQHSNDKRFLHYTVDVKKKAVKMYWKDNQGQPFRSIGRLKQWLESQHQQLVFAMNGGMYKPDNSPQGLFIQEQKVLAALDTQSGKGNFYLKPNGVFYITKNKEAKICTFEKFAPNTTIVYATQSGPMLVIDGKIHATFNPASTSLYIRNGVGILPNGQVVFAISNTEVNLFDFANYFKQLGCSNALYLDGFVSRMYLPTQNRLQTDGNFGVIIAITEKTN